MEPATVSFAVEAKEEIARQDWGDELKRSLLSSYIKINGHLRRSEGKDSLELSSENAQIAKALYSFIHALCDATGKTFLVGPLHPLHGLNGDLLILLRSRGGRFLGLRRSLWLNGFGLPHHGTEGCLPNCRE